MKKDNNHLGKQAKIKIRRQALDAIGPDNARVLDIFCGEQGEMYNEIWHDAIYYDGIDIRWTQTDKRRRYVGDNKVFIEYLDLQRYNVFDVDAYGSPWEIMAVISKRRKWSAGEKGAVTFTDCDMRANLSHQVMGLPHTPRLRQLAYDLHRSALDNWIAQSRLKVAKMWQAQIKGAGPRWYCGLVFTGLGSGEQIAL